MFLTNDFKKFEKIYNLISVIPECEAVDNVRMMSEKQSRVAVN